VLRRLASATRWADLEVMFGLRQSQLSEIFWEGLFKFLGKRAHLIMEDVCKGFWSRGYEQYADAVEQKSRAWTMSWRS